MHGAHETQLIHNLGDVRQRLGNIHAALPVFFEFKLSWKQNIRVVRLMDLDAVRVGLACKPRQLRLGIEQIHLAGSAVLHKLNDRFGLRREMRLPGFEVAGNRIGSQWPAGAEKVRQNDAAEAETASFQQSTAGEADCSELCHDVLQPILPPSGRLWRGSPACAFKQALFERAPKPPESGLAGRIAGPTFTASRNWMDTRLSANLLGVLWRHLKFLQLRRRSTATFGANSPPRNPRQMQFALL